MVLLLWRILCTLLVVGDSGGTWNSIRSRNSSHNGGYVVEKVFSLDDNITTTTTTTTTTAQPSRQEQQRQLASTTTRNATTTTATTGGVSSSSSFFEKHIDASQYVGGKGTLVWNTNDHLLVFVVSNDEEEEREEAAPPTAATLTTEAPSAATTPNDRPMEVEDATTTTTTIANDGDTIVLDCSRYKHWESPPLPCQEEEGDDNDDANDDDDDDHDEDDNTDDRRPSLEDDPSTIEHGSMEEEKEEKNDDNDDDDDNVGGTTTLRNLISLRMIVGMQDPPQNSMDYIQHVTSMVTNQLIQEKTPFHAFYFGILPPPQTPNDNNHDDDNGRRRRRSLATTIHTMITDDDHSRNHHTRRRELESEATASTRQVHLLHAWTTMTPFDYYDDETIQVQDCGGNNKTTQDDRFLRSSSTGSRRQLQPPPPKVEDVVWYETHIEYAALFAYPDGATTQPIQNREYLGNITSYCQWHLDRNIENGKWVRQLDWTIYDWIYNLTTTTTTTPTTTMNDTMLEEMKEDLDFVAAAVMPTSSGVLLDPYWVVELRGRPRTIPTQALVLLFEWREWLGLAMGTITLLVALLLHMSSSYLQRKQHEQQWKATLTEQGIGDVLKVGWRYQVTTTVPTTSRAAAAATTPQNPPQIFLQVYENPKRHFRNEDESSLLQGGVEQEEMGRTTGAPAFVLPPDVAPTQSMSSTSASQEDMSTTPRTRNGMTTESSKLSSSQVLSKQAKKTQKDVKSAASLPAFSSKRSLQDAKQSRKTKLSSNFHPAAPHARNPQCADGTSIGNSSSLLSSGATRLSVDPSGQLHRPSRSHIPSRKGRPCASDLMSSSSTTMTALSLPVTTKTTRKNTQSSQKQPKGLVTKTTTPK